MAAARAEPAILIVGEETPRRWTPHLRASAETISWSRFSERVGGRTEENVAVLDMAAPGAYSLQQASELPRQYPGLRAVIVVDSDAAFEPQTPGAFTQPGLDLISRSRAETDELDYRVAKLLALPWPRPAPAPSPWAALLPELHNPASGRLDARRIAAWLGLPLKTLAPSLERAYATVHKTPDAPGLQPGLRVYLRIASALTHLAGSQAGAQVWLNAPNPDLDGAVPLALLQEGHAETIAQLLEDALAGMPG